MSGLLKLYFVGVCLVHFSGVKCQHSALLQHNSLVQHGSGRVVFDLLGDIDRQNGTHLKKVRGFHGQTAAYRFKGDRNGRVSKETTKEILTALNTAQEYSFVATVRQNARNVGSILAFTHQRRSRRLAELQSAWRKREVRFHYLMASAVNMVATERLPYQLADNHWHRISLSISGAHMSLYVDCHRIYERALSSPMRPHLYTQRGIRLWVGQRGGTNSYFEGALQDVKIVIGPHGHLEQCPETTKYSCPTCGQFMSLAHTTQGLARELQNMKQQLARVEARVAVREQCDCLKRCVHEGKRFESGEKWRVSGCMDCHCKNGTVVCLRRECPVPRCRNPVKIEGECCPKCLRGCSFKGVYYEHGNNAKWLNHDEEEEEEEEEEEMGGEFIKKCALCDCSDGQMKCREATQDKLCPKLDCPKSEIARDAKECCPYCRNADHCGKGHDCHSNASCINLHNRYFCECKKGFRGSGHWCVDVDECASNQGGDYGHYCGANTMCVNTQGSYRCDCVPGFTNVTSLECADRDECADGSHQCSPHATCNNTVGSHVCTCQEGYTGDGKICTPICNQTCLNGGQCVAPNTCGCPNGFRGPSCQHDLDECAAGLSKCAPNSKCVNVPGRYFCQCNHGFTDHGRPNHLGSLCQDVQECFSGHSCHHSAKCANTLGGYKCECPPGGHEHCRDCVYRPNKRKSKLVPNDSAVEDFHDKCQQCHCKNGVLTCTKKQCDCAADFRGAMASCCPQCQIGTCTHQDTGASMKSGERWIYDCEECTCMNGTRECHPLLCPVTSCAIPVHRPGHCCPECPGEHPCSGMPGEEQLLAEGLQRAGPPKSCTYAGLAYPHKAKWSLSHDPCLACSCQDGNVCCTHALNCTAEKYNLLLRQLETTPRITTSSIAPPQHPNSAAASASASQSSSSSSSSTSSSTSTRHSFSRFAPSDSAASSSYPSTSTRVWSSEGTTQTHDDSTTAGPPGATAAVSSAEAESQTPKETSFTTNSDRNTEVPSLDDVTVADRNVTAS